VRLAHDTRDEKEPRARQAPALRVATIDANADVWPIYSKAIAAILATPEQFDIWLSALLTDALKLQRPLPDGSLQIVAMVERPDAWSKPTPQ
jgi:hypothetical protein